MEAVFPAFTRFVKRLLNDVPECPEETRGKKARDDHHEEFLYEGALHGTLLSRYPAAPLSLAILILILIFRLRPQWED
jgi:hypothetical protein